MNLTKSVSIIWELAKNELSQTYSNDLSAKLQAMNKSRQTNAVAYKFSPLTSEWRFIDQSAVDEFVLFLNTHTESANFIKSIVINDL